ncbi:MAG: hypothetical protein HC881_14170 [Leptolyngbyaceae cyanobacterium SL_7_1]|nr:hypothetical protein [Leptolyngbyaceae cyanobacterium SL_7_1]
MAVSKVAPSSDSLALSFDLQPNPDSQPTPAATIAETPPAGTPPSPTPALDEFFQGGSDSLVAVAIGSAEGTRTSTGDRTAAYEGHVDPGNQVWNRGTFSYQHEARSPEEADQKQLRRLRQQADLLHQQASSKGMALTLEEWLNALDLANQAPAAALERGDISMVAPSHAIGLRDADAILWGTGAIVPRPRHAPVECPRSGQQHPQHFPGSRATHD